MRRETAGHAAVPLCAVRGMCADLDRRTQVRVELATSGELLVHVEDRMPALTHASVDGTTLRLEGVLAGQRGSTATLRLSGAVDKRATSSVDLRSAEGARMFRASISLPELESDLQLPTAPQTLRRQSLDQWGLSMRVGKTSTGVRAAPTTEWPIGDRSWSVGTNRSGVAVLVERLPRPIVETVDVREALMLSGSFAAGWRDHRLELVDGGQSIELAADTGPDGRFRVDLLAAAPPEGSWNLVVRSGAAAAVPVPCAFAATLLQTLPRLVASVGGQVVLGVRGRDGPVLMVLRR